MTFNWTSGAHYREEPVMMRKKKGEARRAHVKPIQEETVPQGAHRQQKEKQKHQKKDSWKGEDSKTRRT